MLFSLNLESSINAKLVGHIAFKNPWIHFSRKASEYILYIVKNGDLYIREGQQEYALKKGDMLILQPDLPHVGFRESSCDYYYFHFTHPQISQLDDIHLDSIIKDTIIKRKLMLTSDILSDLPHNSSICYVPKYFHIKNETFYMHLLSETLEDSHKRYENNRNLISCRLQNLLIKISWDFLNEQMELSETSFSKAFIKARSILNYFEREYQKKITSSDIEELFESNYIYLNRVFCRMTGHSILNYLNMVRINKAKELIETTPIKFSEIGYLVGINDQYYFSKMFKKYSGMTPTQYFKKYNSRNTESDGRL